MRDSTNEHPSREILAAFADGRGTDYDLHSVDAHIASCADCIAALDQFSGNATLSERLRDSVAAAPDLLDDLIQPQRSIGDLQPFLQQSTRANALGRLGNYDIIQVLGRGGFGIVFKAFDPALQRLVALKVLAPQLAADPAHRRRFLREARSAAAVLHENVVHIYYVHEDPLPHIMLELVSGENLQDRIDRNGPLAPAAVIHIARQIAGGLAAAHEMGLIHRDIKPANVLLNGTSDPRVKLTDFGLALTAEDSRITPSRLIAGTPMFMSPEQARGDALDSRSDLFGLGSLMYVMLSGQAPFQGPNAMVILKRICDETPQPLTELMPHAPAALCEIIHRLLQKDPSRRIQTAGEVATLLEDLERGSPSRARSRTASPSGQSITPTAQLSPAGTSMADNSVDLTHPMPTVDQHQRPRLLWVAAGGALIVIALVLLWRPARPDRVAIGKAQPDQTGEIQQQPLIPAAPELSPKAHPQPPVPEKPATDLPLNIRGFPADLVEHPLISAKWEWGVPKNLGRAIYPDGPMHEPFVTGDEKTLVFRQNTTTWMSTRSDKNEHFGRPVKVHENLAQLFPVISRDRLTLTFCSTLLSGSGGGFDIWEQSRTSPDAEFGPPRDIGPPVNSPAAEGQPCYSADRLTIIFASSRPGGLGNDDYWQATRPVLDQPFGKPVYLGPDYNFEGQDFAPHLTANDRILLFASARPGSLGHFDIWMCVRATLKTPFSKPINLGPPVNTHHSEGRPSLSDDGQTLYFDSNRPGGAIPCDFWCIRRVLKKT